MRGEWHNKVKKLLEVQEEGGGYLEFHCLGVDFTALGGLKQIKYAEKKTTDEVVMMGGEALATQTE